MEIRCSLMRERVDETGGGAPWRSFMIWRG